MPDAHKITTDYHPVCNTRELRSVCESVLAKFFVMGAEAGLGPSVEFLGGKC